MNRASIHSLFAPGITLQKPPSISHSRPARRSPDYECPELFPIWGSTIDTSNSRKSHVLLSLDRRTKGIENSILVSSILSCSVLFNAACKALGGFWQVHQKRSFGPIEKPFETMYWFSWLNTESNYKSKDSLFQVAVSPLSLSLVFVEGLDERKMVHIIHEFSHCVLKEKNPHQILTRDQN